MERLHPLTASVTGIDGSGKNTALQTAVNRLSPTYKIGVLGKPAYIQIGDTTQKVHKNLTHGSDRLHHAANTTRLKPLSTLASAIDVTTQGRIVERSLHRQNPDLIAGPRDYIIDPSVYSIFYARFLANRTPSQRLNIFQQISGMHFRDIIFHLTVHPDEAVQRIFKREREEKGGNTNMTTPGRYLHEERKHLEKLQNEYPLILGEVNRRGIKNIYTVDTSQNSAAQVADFVTSKLKIHLKRRKD